MSSLLIAPSDPRLRPNPWNTNVVSPENEAKIDASLHRFGVFKPIIVREVNGTPNDFDFFEILGGEHRWQSAKRLGFKEIPVFNVGPIDDLKAKEISLADNARYGVDDALGLSELLKAMGNTDELQNFLPFSDTDLSVIFAASDIALDELSLDEPEPAPEGTPAERTAAAAKTHTVMRFKVALADAERITQVLGGIRKTQNFTTSDDLTNAGDCLVFALLTNPGEGVEP